MPKKAKLRIGETSAMIADELRKEGQERLEQENKREKELQEKLPGIKERYPDITTGETGILPWIELNKMSIGLYERLIKEYKEMLQDVFKNGKDWKCSEKDLEWLKNFLREEKNSLETNHKITVQHQRRLKEGLE